MSLVLIGRLNLQILNSIDKQVKIKKLFKELLKTQLQMNDKLLVLLCLLKRNYIKVFLVFLMVQTQAYVLFYLFLRTNNLLHISISIKIY